MMIESSTPPNEGLTLRDATPRDAAAIAEIYNQSIQAGGACLDEHHYSEADICQLLASFDERESILLIESEISPGDHEILGWGIIKRYSDRRGYRFTCETAVYLRRERVGRGLGTLLKRRQIERCRRLGYHHMVAKILASNTASIEYNRRLGYEVVGIQKEVGFQNGRWQDIAILQLVLDTPGPTGDRYDADSRSTAPPQASS